MAGNGSQQYETGDNQGHGPHKQVQYAVPATDITAKHRGGLCHNCQNGAHRRCTGLKRGGMAAGRAVACLCEKCASHRTPPYDPSWDVYIRNAKRKLGAV